MILSLSIGSFVFGFILLLFQSGQEPSRRIPFWVTAKFLQGAGSLLLFFRGSPACHHLGHLGVLSPHVEQGQHHRHRLRQKQLDVTNAATLARWAVIAELV
jgi:hypothetical protein